MKRFALAALMLLCGPSVMSAQVNYQFINFMNTGSGFSTTLQFRNINSYADPTIVVIDKIFSVSISQRAQDWCGAQGICGIYGPVPVPSGSVQGNTFQIGGQDWFPGTTYSNNGGAGDQVFFSPWDASGNYVGVLGCQVPFRPFPAGYVARTCDADGYTGWLSVDLYYSTNLTGFTYDVSDISAGFSTSELEGPNALNVVPEPSVFLLLAAGLVGVAAARRKRA